MRLKARNMGMQMNSNQELYCDDYTIYLAQLPATLFAQPSSETSGSSMQMPDDPHRLWLQLHSSTLINNAASEFYFDAIPNKIIDRNSLGETFTQHGGSHFFHFLDLSNEFDQ